MSDQDEVVIVGKDGTEHVFPSGFDPQRAASIVRGSSGITPVSDSEPGTFAGGVWKSLGETGRSVGKAALGALPSVGAVVGGALSTPETGGVGTIPGMALGAGVGRGARDLIAHATGLDAPSSPLAKAGAIGMDAATTAAASAIVPGLATAARSPLQTLREGAEQFGSAMPPAIRRLANVFPSLPKAAAEPILARPAWQTWGPSATTAEAAPAAASDVATGLSAADRAALVKQNYSPETIAKIEQAAASQPTALRGQLRMTPESPLRQPRVDVGAEVVGRQNNLTKEAVRQQTGPILDENVGDASPILPEKALQRIIDTMKALPKEGGAREAYVQAATSGKTMAQVENIRRTLQHLGLLVPVGVGAGMLSGRLRMASGGAGGA